jgi:hypothetical protein
MCVPHLGSMLAAVRVLQVVLGRGQGLLPSLLQQFAPVGTCALRPELTLIGSHTQAPTLPAGSLGRSSSQVSNGPLAPAN